MVAWLGLIGKSSHEHWEMPPTGGRLGWTGLRWGGEREWLTRSPGTEHGIISSQSALAEVIES